jgi:lipopolysaccharide transport system ATP-binding protein
MGSIVNQYLQTTVQDMKVFEREIEGDFNQFRKIFMTDANGETRPEYRFDEPIMIRADIYLPEFNPNLELALRLIDKYKQPVFTIHEKLSIHYSGNPQLNLLIKIPERFLAPGSYSWVICINHPGSTLYDLQDDVVNFSVLETGSDFARYNGIDFGRVFVTFEAKLIQE